MTKQEFLDLILEAKTACIINKRRFLFTPEDKMMYQYLNIINDCFEKDIFDPNCFDIIDVVFNNYKINLKSNIHLLTHLINIGINFYSESEIRQWLDDYIMRAKRFPNEVTEPEIATITLEEYENQVKELLKEIQILRKYVSENGEILPVSPEDSNSLDFKHVFQMDDMQINAVIKACNKKYFQTQKQSKQKKELIIPSQSNSSKNRDNVIKNHSGKNNAKVLEQTEQRKLAYNNFSKYIYSNGKQYQVISSEKIDEDTKIEIIRLAKILGISEVNQKMILSIIEKHNNLINKQMENAIIEAEQHRLAQEIEQIKSIYFTAEMIEKYSNLISVIYDSNLLKDPSLNYILSKLKVAKEEIDAVIIGLIKEDLNLEDFKELLEISFEDLQMVLTEASHYQIISETIKRTRKGN